MNELGIDIALLGRFELTVAGDRLAAGSWSRRHAAALVKFLALAPGHRLHREQVIDQLWPDELLDAATPKLHKAAHFARRAIGRDDALVLGGNTVALLPGVRMSVDAVVFEQRARSALSRHDREAALRALAGYGGELLPDDRYEDWAAEPRERLALLHRELLRLAGHWHALVALDPSAEEANLELIRAHVASGHRHAALRQFARMDRALRDEFGVGPSAEAVRLRDELLAEPPADGPRRVDCQAPRSWRRTRCTTARSHPASNAQGRRREASFAHLWAHE